MRAFAVERPGAAPRLVELPPPADGGVLVRVTYAGMNPIEKEALTGLIRFIKDKFQIAVLLVEHDMTFVMNLTDRLVVMEFGTELARGTADEVRRNPRVVEAYLGAPA